MKKVIDLYLNHGHVFDDHHFTTATEMKSFLSDFKDTISFLERTMSRENILIEIKEIRTLASRSKFLERAQLWPRGYQGDFETIEYLLEGINQCDKSSSAYFIEEFFLRSEICKQHKNKVAYQSQMIKNLISRQPCARIISIGCGTSEDLLKNIENIKKSGAEITLVDVDEDALRYSMGRLDEIKANITAFKGNIYKIVRTLKLKYDLIIIGGVFDYLNDQTIVSVLKSLQNNLTTNGDIFFTNIAFNNPYRIFMEYLSDWKLIERSSADLQRLMVKAGWNVDSGSIIYDQTGLSLLCTINNRKQQQILNASQRRA